MDAKRSTKSTQTAGQRADSTKPRRKKRRQTVKGARSEGNTGTHGRGCGLWEKIQPPSCLVYDNRFTSKSSNEEKESSSSISSKGRATEAQGMRRSLRLLPGVR